MAAIEIPPEILEIIFNHNQIAFARTCKWFNDCYRLNIAADYLASIKPVFARCVNCDMIYMVNSIQINDHYHKLPKDKQNLIDFYKKSYSLGIIDKYYRTNYYENDDCTHPARITIYTFSCDVIDIMAKRAATGDRGLLLYMHSCIPIVGWNLIKSIYIVLAKNERLTGFPNYSQLSKQYWENIT